MLSRCPILTFFFVPPSSSVLPPKAFSGMSELESLNLEHTDLRTVALEQPPEDNREAIQQKTFLL